MKTNQKNVEILADLCWLQLTSIFCESATRKNRPPVYLFLSKESEGSLKDRSVDERDFVHFQQERKGGATLKEPPCAWVSRLDQVPEETAHLFALQYKPESKLEIRSIEEELCSMTLHECFGRFAHELILGVEPKLAPRPKQKIREPEDIWHQAHSEGYFLGHFLAAHFFSGELNQKQLKRFWSWKWNGRYSVSSLNRLYRLINLKPPYPQYGKAA